MFITLVKFLLDPFNLFWLLFFGTIGSWFFKKDLLLKWLVTIMLGWFLLISTPLVPVMVVNSLENRYEPLQIKQLNDTEAGYHIIVLGGGHGFDERLPPNSLLSQNALGRLNEGIRLHRQLANSKLVFSGFSGSGRTTHAEILQSTAELLGVDKKKTILQKEPENTFEEAKIYSENYGISNPVILVSSAVHMPRALNAFKRFDIDPLPSPTNFKFRGSWKRKWFGIPETDNIEKLKIGIYEYAGIFWYSF